MTNRMIMLFICFFVPLVYAIALAKTISFLIEHSANRRDKIDILFIFCLTAYSLIMVGSGCGHLFEGLL